MTLFCQRAATLTNDLKSKCFLALFSCLELCLDSPEELHGVYVCVLGYQMVSTRQPLLRLGFSLQTEICKNWATFLFCYVALSVLAPCSL